MPDINPSIPIAGQPNSSEEPKIVTALSQLVAAVNDVDSAQILDLAVSTADLAAGAVTAAKIETQQAWQTVALPAGLSSGSLAYYKDSLGYVRFRGDKFAGAGAGMAANATLATMPAGYRPGVTHFGLLHQHAQTPTPIPVSVTTAGVIALTDSAVIAGSAGSGNAVFSELSYRAEN